MTEGKLFFEKYVGSRSIYYGQHGCNIRVLHMAVDVVLEPVVRRHCFLLRMSNVRRIEQNCKWELSAAYL